MIAIKDLEMPTCCGDCPCFHESSVYTCGATGELLPDAWVWKCRSEDCPLVEKEFVVEFNAPDVAEEDLKKAELKTYKTMVEKVKEFRKMSEYIIEAKEGRFGTGTFVGELVRCGECRYFSGVDKECLHGHWDISQGWQYPKVTEDDFCSYGEVKE